MKKNYIEPQTQMVVLSTEQLMQTVSGAKLTRENADADLETLSRKAHSSVWGNDDEEEF